jgi:quinol-cytochrome oxidoreductase complex cytochrome b subunit
MRLIHLPLIRIVVNHIVHYPTPTNLNYLWSLGSVAGLLLVLQLISGILLAIHYTPNVDLAFASTEHIMRNVNYGWLLRYAHSNGASFFFIIIFIHILKNIYYKSFYNPRVLLWLSGILLFFLIIATAFLGYVLPWGQISFWGATVITNFFTAIPLVGQTIAQWLWGGFSISNATLNRFFSLHYLLPFIISGLALLHLILLHSAGSNNPLGIHEKRSMDKIDFYPYFYVKDLFSFIVVLLIITFTICYYPNLLGHPDNYIPANSLVTPTHIVPEWYFSLFYAILRSIPNKLGGVLAMVGSILILVQLIITLQLVSTSSQIRTPLIHFLFNIFFWLLLLTAVLLSWIGAQPVESPFVCIGLLSTIYYFTSLSFGIIICLKCEQYLIYYDESLFKNDLQYID